MSPGIHDFDVAEPKAEKNRDAPRMPQDLLWPDPMRLLPSL